MRSACSFTTRIECPPTKSARRSRLAGAEVRPRLPCPISGVPTHKHRPARCACALGRPPVACSDASLACASQPRRVWTQPRWSFIASLAQRSESTGLRSRGLRPDTGCACAQPVPAEGRPLCERAACKVDVQVVHEAPTTTPRWTSGEVLGPSSRRGGFNSRTGYQFRLVIGAIRQHSGLQNRRLQVQVLHDQPHQTKLLGELTLRGAQTGRNDWAASEPVTDNLFNTCRHSSVGRAPVCRTGGRGVRTRWRRHSLPPGEHHEEEPHPQLSRR